MDDTSPLLGVSALQALPSINALTLLEAGPVPTGFRLPGNPYASGPAAVVVGRPFIRRMAEARTRQDPAAFDLARQDFLATVSTATALDMMESFDVGRAAGIAGLPKVQKAMQARMTLAAGTVFALAWLTSTLRPEEVGVRQK